jgi:hypothetical protein
MKRMAKLSRQARLRRHADTHKMRRHWHKRAMRMGYTATVVAIDPDGRKHWVYTYRAALARGGGA